MTIGKKINSVGAATTLNDLPKGARYLGSLSGVYSRDADQTFGPTTGVSSEWPI